MNIHQAVNDIRDIGDVLARSAHSTCFRPVPILITAIVAAVSSTICEFAVGKSFTELSFVLFWIAVAALNLAVLTFDLGMRYRATESELVRGKTRHIIYQLVPCLMLGAVVTVCLMRDLKTYGSILPGLWCCFVSLGIFSTLANGPRKLIYPATFYALVGACYLQAADSLILGPWSMGLAFGVGQAWLAYVHWQRLRYD